MTRMEGMVVEEEDDATTELILKSKWRFVMDAEEEAGSIPCEGK
jgi:hypothetical protein